MADISATEAARSFADLLDAVEHRGEDFTIVRRGKPVAHLEPVSERRGRDLKRLLSSSPPDPRWGDDVTVVRRLVEIDLRQWPGS